ncbi:TfoX/Sxy family protein [uncultured Roseobacter sp.]|uniref:TfoX/Sxy family protein n=1 Tax=uncultured Roseobacter sp. TaxID=114847 RepID=UPI0026061392|nr:TfoX/Sxy family protein [uncultured Roseobacter sp.]
MDNPNLTVRELKNIGATVAQRLYEVGIRTQDDLKRVGAVTAYCEMKRRHPGARTPLCYYLYSLEGALRDQHWDRIGEDVKETLRNDAARFLNAT